ESLTQSFKSMKKTLFAAVFSVFLSVLCFVGNTKANSAYYIDDNEIEGVFEKCVNIQELLTDQTNTEYTLINNYLSSAAKPTEKKAWVAVVLAAPYIHPLGILGIHRWYLGT